MGKVIDLLEKRLEEKYPERPHLVEQEKAIIRGKIKGGIIGAGIVVVGSGGTKVDRYTSIGTVKYELRLFGGPLGNSPYRRKKQNNPLTVAFTSSGHGVPKWMQKVCQAVNEAEVTSVEEALKIAEGNAYFRRNKLSNL